MRALGSLAGFPALTFHELRLALRGPGVWLVGATLALLGYLQARTAADPSSFRLGWILARQVAPIALSALIFLAGSLAYRPWRFDAVEMEVVRPVAPEYLTLARWISLQMTLLFTLAFAFVGAIGGQYVHSKLPLEPVWYGYGLADALPIVVAFGSMSFLLVSATGVFLAGVGLTALFWFAIYFGGDLTPFPLRLGPSQNHSTYLLAAAVCTLGALAGIRGRSRNRGTRLAQGLWLLAALSAGALLLRVTLLDRFAPGPNSARTAMRRLTAGPRSAAQPAGRDAAPAPAPNLAWTTDLGRRVSLAGMRGSPLAVVALQPLDRGLAGSLLALNAAAGELRRDGVRCLALLISEDLGSVERVRGLLAAGELNFDLAPEWGSLTDKTFGEKRPTSVFSSLLKIEATPTALVLDAEGAVIARDLPADPEGLREFAARVRAAIDAKREPEEAAAE